MVTTHDEALERRLRRLKFHGIAQDAWARYGPGGDPAYEVAEPGFKAGLTDLQAALGLSQLAKLGRFNARRAGLAARYRRGLAGVAGLDLPQDPPYPHVHAWHLFVVKVTGMPRQEFLDGLAARSIGYGIHFPPCHRLEYVVKRFGAVALPQTERAGGRLVSLPLFPGMTDADVDDVCAAVREILGIT